ncbi:MAG: hypothetical protein IJK98_04455 [Clostridia bacterium]|nr:hypothetical protein [Clostridia bacterium]
MSTKAKIVIASCAAAALLIGLIASACVPVKIVVQTPVVIGQQAAQPENTAVNTVAQPAQSQPATEPATASQNDSAAQPTEAAAPPADGSMSTEEIVSLYNTAVNKVKQEATNLTRNYKHVSAPEDQLELPSAIQGLGKTAIGTFVKGTDTPESWTSKEDMQIVFPVGNTDYSSHLTADMVETATCEEVGGTYKITLKLYDDKLTSPAKGEGYAGVFNTTTASTFTEINIPTVTFNRVDINGVNGSITCTVDKATQHVTEITFANTDILKLEVKVVVATLNVKLALAVEENYSVAY